MYQTIRTDGKEEYFKELQDCFESTIIKLGNEEDNSKWDLNSQYTPNWACLWNSPENINKKCKIVEKNNKIALVIFEGKNKLEEDDFLKNIYRLEDLTKIN